jgi:hypothetical protein
MVATEFVKARLPLELKERVKALADSQLLSESAWLKRLVVREVQAADGERAVGPGSVASGEKDRAGHRSPGIAIASKRTGLRTAAQRRPAAAGGARRSTGGCGRPRMSLSLRAVI